MPLKLLTVPEVETDPGRFFLPDLELGKIILFQILIYLNLGLGNSAVVKLACFGKKKKVKFNSKKEKNELETQKSRDMSPCKLNK